MKDIIILIISAAVFDFLFLQLNKFNPKILFLFHKIPEKWKGKWPIKWAAIFTLLLINAIIVVYFELDDSIGYIISGFIISLCEFALKKPKEANIY